MPDVAGASESTLRLTIPADAAPQRADRVAADLSGLSRSHVQRLIAEGRLTADGRPLKANAVLSAGAVLQLTVPPPAPSELEPRPDIVVPVVYEDEDLLIVDKPAGLVVHPAPGHSTGTLVNALLGRGEPLSGAGIAGVQRPGIVHRLDRDTSGLLMVARTDAAQASLQAQLKARRVKKTYLALVAGSVAAGAGRIEAPIGRDPGHRTRMAVVAGGRPATTLYRVRERFDGWTLLELDLVTGRTHQLRVHLAAIGHSIAGDTVYGTAAARRGPAGLDRLFLHSWRLELTAASGDRLIRAEAPLPPELETTLVGLREPRLTAERSVVGAPGALLVIVSGPSGVGKDTVINELKKLAAEPPRHFVVTCTTRERRPYEEDGVHYHFLTRREFVERRDAGELLEANQVHGNWYGTPRDEVRTALVEGRDVVLKIDVQGAAVVKQKVPEALLVFLVPPSLEDLFGRLQARATESADELDVRQRNAALELARQKDYDHVVRNETGEVEATAARIDAIIRAEKAAHPDRRTRV